jgi:hypothetical protein
MTGTIAIPQKYYNQIQKLWYFSQFILELKPPLKYFHTNHSSTQLS